MLPRARWHARRRCGALRSPARLDPHLPPMPEARLRDLFGKRALGYLNWTRNRHKYHRREVLDALVSDLQAQTPDHIAITGDLVNLALEAEFEPSRAWLESVGAPDRVTVIPNGVGDDHSRRLPVAGARRAPGSP